METTVDVPFFSIILPVFNGEKFISETLQSVLQQSFSNWELIVINDGSTDKTANLLENFCKQDERIRVLHQSNKKQPAARNAGLKMAAGKWIAFIDADDLWLPVKLQLQYQCIQANKELDVIFSDGYTKYEDKKIRLYYHYEIAKGFTRGTDLYKKMLFGNYIPVLSAVLKSKWISKIGMQDESVPGVEDHDYWLRLCRAGANFYGMKDRLFVYRIHDSNFSSNLVNQHYLSLIIRLKNFDRKLLGDEEMKRFRQAFYQYLQYFHDHGKTEWDQDLREKFKNLGIPAMPVSEQIKEALRLPSRRAKFLIRQLLKKWKHSLLRTLYFYPKKKFSPYKDRIFALYNNWLNAPNIKNYGSVNMSPTAKINFFDRSHVNLDVQDIYIGDFTRINFMEENSMIIGGSDLIIGKFCNLNIVGQLILGNNVLFNNYSAITCHTEIVIGDDSWFGEGVRLYDHNHRYQERSIPFSQQGYTEGKIQIGNNVWVGSNTVILQNVSIGDGCVIGANNVIYKSLPPNTILKSRSMEIIHTIK